MTVTIHRESDHLWAEVAELPGCFASGRDMCELGEALAEAITMWAAPGTESLI